MEGHTHAGVLFAVHVVSIVIIFHFLTRTWAGLQPNNPAMQGLAFVA